MKRTFLIFTVILFSLLSGAIGAFLYIQFLIPLIKGPETKEITIIAEPVAEEIVEEDSPTMAEGFQALLTDTVKNTAPSVVSIIIKKDLVIYRSDPWGFFQQPTGTVTRQVGGGSGFFIKEDGTILTNKHVVADPNADYTIILNNGKEYDAQVLALDPVNDLAIIKIIGSDETFSPLPLVASPDDIEIGEFAVAVGNALAEFQNSVSLGIISGKDRAIEAQGESLSGLIQTDAAINPGNSGGPLLDLDGKVMGINTAIVSGANGVGFSIALTQERVDYMLESIAKSGRIKRPFIGISYIQNSPGIAAELSLGVDYGAYIIDEAGSIIEGSSAEKSGIEPGDIILEVAGKKIDAQVTLGSILQNSIPGETLSLKILKKSGEEQNIQLELGEY